MIIVLDSERLQATCAGSVDTDFDDQWLMDARHSFPAKKTGGLSIVCTPVASVMADVFAVVNHNIPAGAGATVGALATIVTPAFGADGIARNAYKLLGAPVSVSSAFTFSTSGEVVGELWVGPGHNVARVKFLMGVEFDPGIPFRWETSLAPYPDGMSEPRRKRGELILSASDYAQFESWYTATKKGTRPSLIIFDSAVNDAWLCTWQFSARHSEGWYFVTMEILELPRTEW
jgi:hypothetical protein